MSVYDRTDLGQAPTVPDKLTQKPAFGAITETVKDAFVLELRHYLETKYTQIRTNELLRIDKYSVAGDAATDPLETAVALIRTYPDLTENLPLIAVSSTTGRNVKLGLSDKFVSMVVYPAKVAGVIPPSFSNFGLTYALAAGMDLSLTTTPNGTAASLTTSRFIFQPFMFTDINNATLDEVIAAINFQALYVTASSTGSAGSRAFVNLATAIGSGGALDSVLELTNVGHEQNFPPTVRAPIVDFVADSTGAVYITRQPRFGELSGANLHFTVHFNPSVSTVADVEAAIQALSGPDDLFGVKTPGTGSAVLQSSDAAGAVQFFGGFDVGTPVLAIRAGGQKGTLFPNVINITGGTALAPLGLVVSQTDQNFGAGKLAYERHHVAADLTVNIEVMAESENVRTDLTDLVYDFFTYVMADRKFQFYGRSIFDDTILDETYQIILKDNEFSFGGDTEVPRPSDNKDKIYVSRLSIPVTAILYSDRIITNSDGTSADPVVQIQLINNFDFPEPN